jgi:hypothetical protein
MSLCATQPSRADDGGMTSAWRVREITGSDFFIADRIYRKGTNTPKTTSSFVVQITFLTYVTTVSVRSNAWKKRNMVGKQGVFDTVLFPADNLRFPLLRDAIILERVIRNRLVPVYP